MSKEKKLKREILEKVGEYYSLVHKNKGPFVPGKTPIPYAGRVFDEHELTNLVDSSLEFWLTHGRYSREFEERFSNFLGVKHCYLVNSGSSANLLAFMALTSDKLGDRKIRRGDEVITVAAGFPTTVTPIIQYGAVPVFVDVSLPTYNIDCNKLEAAFTSKTKAVMIAHTLGNPFDIDRVKAFCQKHDLWLIEDNCDSLGSRYNGQLTGTFGDIGTSSFYPPHHMTMGEGGAIYTNDETLSDILLSLRDWGRDCTCPSGKDNTCGKRFSEQFGTLPIGYDHKYVYSHFGYNLKASDMQAAIGCAQLDKIEQFITSRKENFAILRAGLQDLEKEFILPKATSNSDPSWFGFPLTVRKTAPFTRNDIVRHLENAKIQTRMLFAGNLIRHPCFDGMRQSGESYKAVSALPETDRVMTNTFWIGVYPDLKDEHLDHMLDSIRTYVKIADC